jgi:hypothetical protein
MRRPVTASAPRAAALWPGNALQEGIRRWANQSARCPATEVTLDFPRVEDERVHKMRVSLEQSEQLLHALGFLLRGFFLRGFGFLFHGLRPFPVCKDEKP